METGRGLGSIWSSGVSTWILDAYCASKQSWRMACGLYKPGVQQQAWTENTELEFSPREAMGKGENVCLKHTMTFRDWEKKKKNRKKRHKGFYAKRRDYYGQAVDSPTRQGEAPAELDKSSAREASRHESWAAD